MKADRDLTLDLTRVVCVLLVVVIHLLQVGIGFDSAGALVINRPAEEQPWFAIATWFGQVMPLFFVVGGFAAAAGWASHTSRGGDAASYVRARTLRLAQPAFPLFVFFALALGIATLLGLAPDVVAAAATGAGMPLWFLAAYVLVQTAVPRMTHWDAVAPRTTMALLLLGVIAVDALRYSTGISDIGLINLALVWLLAQQLGFWYFRGVFDRLAVVLIGVAVLSYLVLAALVAWGPYSSNMLTNLNPPTLPLVVLAVAQACILRLLKRPLTALMRLRIAQGAVFVVGSRLMTVYLWHLPVILLVTGVTLLIPGGAPAPASAAWWATRPLMFVVVALVLYALSILIVRWEAVPDLPRQAPIAPVAVGALLTFAPAFAVMQWGLNVWFAVAGAICLGAALRLLRRSAREVMPVRLTPR